MDCAHENKAYANIPPDLVPPRQGKWICKDCGAYGHVPAGQTPTELVVEGEYAFYVAKFKEDRENI